MAFLLVSHAMNAKQWVPSKTEPLEERGRLATRWEAKRKVRAKRPFLPLRECGRGSKHKFEKMCALLWKHVAPLYFEGTLFGGWFERHLFWGGPLC